ncbi:MAG: ABC transporter substrate-binding protein [Chloroflexi bacterium]|nr:ABC transporter substrate-binding protein [Chloroflexota bacterium]
MPLPASAQTLTLWNPFTGPDGGFFKQIVDDYNAATPECQITVQTQPGGEYVAKLEAARDGNALPQIIAAGYDGLPGLSESKIVTPIDDLASAAGMSESTFPAAIWNAGIWKGQRLGIPIDTHPMTFYYNKKLFRDAGLDPETPPTDMASFEAVIKAVKEKTGKDGYQMVSSGPGASFLVGIQFASLFYQAGGKWTSDDYSEATFNSEAGIKAAEYLAKLVNELGVPKVESDAEIAAFKQGKNAMVFSGIWESSGYNDALGADLGVGPIPSILGDGAWGGSHNLAVTAGATPDQRMCAYNFIDTFSRNSIKWAAAGQVPARNEVRESADLTGATEGLLPIIAKVAPIAETVQFLPSIPGGGDILFAANGAGEAAVFVIGGKGAKEALDAAALFNTDILKTNKERYGY